MATAAFLAQLPLFGNLAPADLKELATYLQPRQFTRGETIFCQGQFGNTCYLVHSGHVKIAASSAEGKQITIALLGPGDLFGEMAVLDEPRRSADAVALDGCQLLELHRNHFLAFLHAHPVATFILLVALAQRLRRTDQRLEDAAFLSVPARLAKVLIELAEGQGEQTSEGVLIPLLLTQSELAAFIGASRESVNKWLGSFEQQGIIGTDGGRIVLRDLGRLRAQIG